MSKVNSMIQDSLCITTVTNTKGELHSTTGPSVVIKEGDNNIVRSEFYLHGKRVDTIPGYTGTMISKTKRVNLVDGQPTNKNNEPAIMEILKTGSTDEETLHCEYFLSNGNFEYDKKDEADYIIKSTTTGKCVLRIKVDKGATFSFESDILQVVSLETENISIISDVPFNFCTSFKFNNYVREDYMNVINSHISNIDSRQISNLNGPAVVTRDLRGYTKYDWIVSGKKIYSKVVNVEEPESKKKRKLLSLRRMMSNKKIVTQ